MDRLQPRSTLRDTVHTRITMRTAAYATLPLFEAFRADRIPVERFADFFREQYMTARWFQDLIWATTEIHQGPYAEFAAAHRRRDSGHHHRMKSDLERFGLQPMTDEDWFRPEWLETRIQLARILARCHDATPEERLVILACLESAGAVTLGTLNEYVRRHGLGDQTRDLGEPHARAEREQVGELERVAKDLLDSSDGPLLDLVGLVFDALSEMFARGGERYYGEHLRPS